MRDSSITPVPVEAFARFNTLSNPRLSPDGTHLALANDLGEGRFALSIVRLADRTPIALLPLPWLDVPIETRWVNTQRLIIATGRKSSPIAAAVPRGEIIAVDIDGSHQSHLHGPRDGHRMTGVAPGFGIIEGLPDVPNGHFYMRSLTPHRSRLYDVDAMDGTLCLLADLPGRDLRFIWRHDGTVAFAFGVDDDDNFRLLRRERDGTWTPLSRDALGGDFRPVACSRDGTSVFGYFSAAGEPSSFVRCDRDGRRTEVLAQEAFASMDALLWTAAPPEPFAVCSGAGIPAVHYFDEQSHAALQHRALRAALPGLQVDYVEHTAAGDRSLVFAHSDRAPGTWYLHDRSTRRLSALLELMPGIVPERMGERRPFRFAAHDGLLLEGIMTLPPGIATPSRLPTVLMPHGGPHVPGDAWAFDPWAQFLASRGYLVLQVNFRGTQGRGRVFEEAGFRQWAGAIPDDLIAGADWAIANGIADASRVAAIGASFGAFAAMHVAAKAPHLFRCVVGVAGIYDLPLMYRTGDLCTARCTRNYLARAIGEDEAQLRTDSATSHAASIRAAVLLIHGDEDERAPLAQALAMRAALERAGHPTEWLHAKTHGHGFHDEASTIVLYRRIECFIAQNLMPPV